VGVLPHPDDRAPRTGATDARAKRERAESCMLG
jgi:hypothetical protein